MYHNGWDQAGAAAEERGVGTVAGRALVGVGGLVVSRTSGQDF